jgi:hypothetical protein
LNLLENSYKNLGHIPGHIPARGDPQKLSLIVRHSFGRPFPFDGKGSHGFLKFASANVKGFKFQGPRPFPRKDIRNSPGTTHTGANFPDCATEKGVILDPRETQVLDIRYVPVIKPLGFD